MKDFAVIFDMDGVIVNNSEYHTQAWHAFCDKYAGPLTEEDFRLHILGRNNRDTLSYIFKRDMTDEEINQYGEEKESLYRELYTPHIKATPHLYDFLELLRKNNINTSIATSADRPNVDFVLNALDIREYFSSITDTSAVTHSKPDPEIYLAAAQTISYGPSRCIVIEDTVSGIRAGKAAGMKVIAITTTHGKEDLQEADFIIDDFDQLSSDTLRRLLA